MIAKALTLPADGLILDLEDAVAPDRRRPTRPIVRRWLDRRWTSAARERWVRMNPIATGLGVADLEETIAGRPDGYVVPKPRHAGDVREIVADPRPARAAPRDSARLDAAGADRHRDAGGPAEHPRGRGGQPADRRRVVGHRGPGRGDGPAARARRRGPLSRHPALRARHVRGGRGRGRACEAIDTVYTDIADLDGLRRECEEGVAMGFTGKISIHPGQIEVINEVFTPRRRRSPRRRS